MDLLKADDLYFGDLNVLANDFKFLFVTQVRVQFLYIRLNVVFNSCGLN